MNTPAPDQQKPLLVSAGNQQFTRHRYLGTIAAQHTDENGQTTDALAHIYKCDVTGVERVWGMVECPN